ncbi:envelope stress response membrane protein PspC [Megalodesulfovibrio gigas]|nr:envelope stress response membrane protein PspC [Megalodesulfovibrio gigas]
MMLKNTSGIYRARDGMVAGVCKGLARHFDIRVRWLRLGVILLAVFTGFWPVLGLYVVAALIMKLEPVLPTTNDGAREFYDSYAGSRQGAAHRLKDKFDNMDRRVRRMEDIVTSKEYDWDRRFSKDK